MLISGGNQMGFIDFRIQTEEDIYNLSTDCQFLFYKMALKMDPDISMEIIDWINDHIKERTEGITGLAHAYLKRKSNAD
jgi:hypothetical protein